MDISKIEVDYKPDLEPEKTICRCCLTTEKRMLNVSLFVPQFLDLAGLKVSESDGLPPWLCYECAGLLQKAIRFKHKMLRANSMLCDYLMRCAPFPIDALDPELGKYATPNLMETNTLAFDNSGRKLGFYKTLEHEKRPVDSALHSIELPPPLAPVVEPVEPTAPVAQPLKVEMDSFSDYEDNITLEEFRMTVPKTEPELPDERLVKVEEDSKKKKKTKKKEQPKAKRKKSKEAGGEEPVEGAEPKTSIRKTVELDPTKIRVIMLDPEEQFKQSEEESKAKFPYQCDLCYKGFNFDSKLENHMRKHSPSRGPFSCTLCSMYFPSAYSRSVHAHIHTRRYECCACGRRMIDRASILDHYRTQHEGLVSHFTCHLCGKVSNNSKTHRGHMRNHHSGQRPECEQCGKTFINKDSLEEHRQIHQGIKNYSCSECGKRFRTRAQIKHHQLKHTDLKEYYCVECDVRFKSAHSLRQHLVKSLKHKDKQSLKYACTRCDKRFEHSRLLARHAAVQHDGLRAHACGACPAALASRASLAKHRRHVHQGARPAKRHVCDACGKAFRVRHAHYTHACPAALASRASLAKHRRHVHQDARPAKRHVCDACGKAFRVRHAHYTHACPAALASRASLAKHRRHVHQGARPAKRHVCDACGKAFRVRHAHYTHACPAALASRASLAKHRRHVHQGARPAKRHVCDACGKAFRGKSVLVNHVRTHTGEKPFSCATCGRKFSQRTAMRTHVDLVHLKRRRGKAKPEPAATEEPKIDLFTKEETPLVFDAWRQNMPNCEVYFTVTAGP